MLGVQTIKQLQDPTALPQGGVPVKRMVFIMVWHKNTRETALSRAEYTKFANMEDCDAANIVLPGPVHPSLWLFYTQTNPATPWQIVSHVLAIRLTCSKTLALKS